MSKNTVSDPGQDALFEIGADVVPAPADVPRIVPNPVEIRAYRSVSSGNVSHAYEELGGGVVPHEPEPLTPEESLELQSIDHYEKSRYYSRLARGDSSDPEVKKAGGKMRSKALASQHMMDSRRAYLRSQNLPTELPDKPTVAEQDAHDAAVEAWMKFRTTVLENDSERMALARELAGHVS